MFVHRTLDLGEETLITNAKLKAYLAASGLSKGTRYNTMLSDQKQNKRNWHYRIHTETKVEIGRAYSQNEGQ